MAVPQLFADQAEKIERLLPERIEQFQLNDPVFQFMPIKTTELSRVDWVIQDDYSGLQGASIFEGQSEYVERIGDTHYQVEPGVFRDKADIKETELTQLRDLTDRMLLETVEQMSVRKQEQLQVRQNNRILYDLWNLLVYGTLSITNFRDQIVGKLQYTRNLTTVGTPWTTVASATPLKDLRSFLTGVEDEGTSSIFNAGSVAFANSTTIAYMLNNTNTADLGGKLRGGGNTPVSLDEMNEIFAADDIPKFVRYGNGYRPTKTTFTKFIPNGYIVVFGSRPGNAPVGSYTMTRNAVQGEGKSGTYFMMKDKTDEVPPCIEFYQGHNGCPVINYPTAVRVIKVIA